MQIDDCQNDRQMTSLRSGVSLEYSPEDTLKSFIMEKYMKSVDAEAIDNNSEQINSNCNAKPQSYPVTGAFTFNTPRRDQPGQTKRTGRFTGIKSCNNLDAPAKFPYLRKNHGTSAWCSRIRSSTIKSHTNVRIETRDSTITQDQSLPSESLPVAATAACSTISRQSSEDDQQSYSKAITIGSRSCGLNKLYTHNSPWYPLLKHKLFPITPIIDASQHDSIDEDTEPSLQSHPHSTLENKRSLDIVDVIQKKSNYIQGVNATEAGELEEFEQLERMTENQPQSSFDGHISDSTIARLCNEGIWSTLFHQDSNPQIDSGSEMLVPLKSPSNKKIKGSATDLHNEEMGPTTCFKSDIAIIKPARENKYRVESNPSAPLKSILSNNEMPTVISTVFHSVDFDDNVPWHEFADEPTPQKCSRKEFNSSQDTPVSVYQSVRFDLHESHGIDISSKQNAVVNLGGDTATRSISDMSVPPPNTSTALVKQWIAQLELEVKRFNAENAALTKLKEDRQQEITALEKQRKQFEESKSMQMKEFESFRQDETAKIKKERQVLLDFQRALHSMPNKKDREEIEKLNKQISELQTESAQKEIRMQNQLTRQRTRIEELGNERTELLERIKRLEQTRITLQSNLAHEKATRTALVATASTSQASELKSRSLETITQSIAFQPHNTSLLCVARTNLNPVYIPTAFKNKTTIKQTGLSCTAAGETDSQHALATTHTLATFPEPEEEKKCRRSRCPSGQSDYYTGEEDLSSSTTGSFIREVMKQGMPEIVSPAKYSLPQLTLTHDLSQLPSTYETSRGPVVREICHPDGSIERLFSNMSKMLKYTNGSVKEIFPDGKTSLVRLFNGDTKRTLPDNTVIYTYASEGTIQTTYPDGTEEIAYKNGRREVNYPIKPVFDGQVETTPFSLSSANQEMTMVEEVCHPDGNVVRRYSNGDRVINLANGQQEIHCADYKRRIYPDGTTKTVYTNGRQETRYASGRIRAKDSAGRLLMDTRVPPLTPSLSSDNLKTAPLASP